ncbi:MAG: thiamine diphosphokinase [Pseudomonadota bacterium]
MEPPRLSFAEPVILAGGGVLTPEMLAAARRLAGPVIAADSAADALAGLGCRPDAVIGDLDSIADAAAWRRRGVPVHHLAEQDSTDFEKCLYSSTAPYYVAIGFTGRRVDHMLAVFHALLRYPEKPVLLLGEEEAMALAPPGQRLSLALEAGARVSVFPLLEVGCGPSTGLVWPLDGLTLAPGLQVGTSNRAAAARVEMVFDRPGALVMLEPRFLGALRAALVPQAG